MAYPTICKFINRLRKSEKRRDMEHEQMVAGYATPAKERNIRMLIKEL